MAIAGVSKDSCYEWCPGDCKFKVLAEDYWEVLND